MIIMGEPTKIIGLTTTNDGDKPYTQAPSDYALLEARIRALENLVDLLRDELYAMRDGTEGEVWIGGTESEGE